MKTLTIFLYIINYADSCLIFESCFNCICLFVKNHNCEDISITAYGQKIGLPSKTPWLIGLPYICGFWKWIIPHWIQIWSDKRNTEWIDWYIGKWIFLHCRSKEFLKERFAYKYFINISCEYTVISIIRLKIQSIDIILLKTNLIEIDSEKRILVVKINWIDC